MQINSGTVQANLNYTCWTVSLYMERSIHCDCMTHTTSTDS